MRGTAGTTPRFLLLAALVLVTAVEVFGRVNAVLFYDNRRDLLAGLGCYLAAGEDPARGYAANQAALQRPGVADALEVCLKQFGQRDPLWPLIPEMGALVLAAAVLYFVLPLWKARPSRVVPLDERIDPGGELLHHVREMTEVAGLARPPRFVVDPAARTPGAVVFGRWRRYTVCLHGGLLVRRIEDPSGFRAVVLHELAHLRNRDVDITYATVALWRVFLVVMPAGIALSIAYLLPIASELFAAQNHRDSVHDFFQTAFLIVLVYLARADVLRVRELHADFVAAQWAADPRAWQQHDPKPPTRLGGRLLRLARAPWRTHPEWVQRERALTDPAFLFDVPRLPVFLTGVTVLIVAGTAQASQRESQRGGFDQVTTVASLFGAALATAVVGALLRQATAHTQARAIRTGLWFGAGLVTGELVLSRTERPQYLLVLLLIGTIIMWWMAENAELGTGRAGLVVTWLVLAMWLAWWQSAGNDWVQGRPVVNPQGVLRLYGLTDGPVTASLDWVLGRLGTDQYVLPGTRGVLVASTMIWVLPLLRRSGSGLPLRRIVLCAAGGGLISVGALAVVRLRLHDAVPSGAGRLAALSLYDAVWSTVALTATATVAAVVAGARSGRLRLLTGLATAGITMLLGQAAWFVLQAANGPWGGAWSFVTSNTAVLLGPCMFVVAGALLVLAPLRNRPDVFVARRSRLAVGAVVIAVVVLGAASWAPARHVSSPAADGTAPTIADFPVASSRIIEELRVLAWMKYGGQQLLNRISAEQNDFTTVGSSHSLPFVEILKRLRADCADIETDVAKARAYFPLPDNPGWQYWATYLDDSGKAATNCRQALDTGDNALFKTAILQMQQTYFSHRKVYDRLQTYLG